MRFLRFFFLCAMGSLAGSPCVKYEILSIDGNLFTLTNKAVFQVTKETSSHLSTWNVGETVVMQAVPEFSEFQDTPHLLFENNEQGTLVLAELIEPPVSINSGTYSIMSVNVDQRMINLSDTSAWLFAPFEVKEVVDWSLGDLIMIGQSLISSDYDTILFDTTQQSVICAQRL